MIKTVRKIKTVQGKYPTPLDIFEFTPPFNDGEFDYDFLSGAYYGKTGYPQVALFASDEDGNMMDQYPVIHEEGIAKYQNLFEMFGYTLI